MLSDGYLACGPWSRSGYRASDLVLWPSLPVFGAHIFRLLYDLKAGVAASAFFEARFFSFRPSPAEDEAALSHPRIGGQAADACLALPLTVAIGV